MSRSSLQVSIHDDESTLTSKKYFQSLYLQRAGIPLVMFYVPMLAIATLQFSSPTAFLVLSGAAVAAVATIPPVTFAIAAFTVCAACLIAYEVYKALRSDLGVQQPRQINKATFEKMRNSERKWLVVGGLLGTIALSVSAMVVFHASTLGLAAGLAAVTAVCPPAFIIFATTAAAIGVGCLIAARVYGKESHTLFGSEPGLFDEATPIEHQP